MKKLISQVDLKKCQDKIYPNSSLVEVIAEIRFPLNLSIESHRDVFFGKIKDTFPGIVLPPTLQNPIMALAPYIFSNRDSTSWLMMAANRFSYHTKKYKGHKKFINEFNELINIFGNVFSLSELERIGYRYINIIPYARYKETIPVNQFLKLDLVLPENLPHHYRYLNVMFELKVGDGTIMLRLTPVKKSNNGQEALMLDFDYGITTNLVTLKVKDKLNEAHKYIRDLFETLITDSYRQFLRGDAL